MIQDLKVKQSKMCMINQYDLSTIASLKICEDTLLRKTVAQLLRVKIESPLPSDTHRPFLEFLEAFAQKDLTTDET